jgi:hypothetical protein
MKFQSWRNLFLFSCFFIFSASLLAQNQASKTVDSTLLKTALTLNSCIENQKKIIGKEVLLQGLCVGSTEIELEKEGSFYLLELDDNFPNNKISIIVSEADADLLNFSRYTYHQKRLVIKGKLEKSKKFKDEFGNPRLVLNIKNLEQITMF